MAIDWSGFQVVKAVDDEPRIPVRDRRSAGESGIARFADLTPEEREADEEFNRSPGNLAMLDRAIQDERNPKSKAILVAERARLIEDGAESARGDGKVLLSDRAPVDDNPWAGFKVVSTPKGRSLAPESLIGEKPDDYLDALGKGFSDLAVSAKSARWMMGGGSSRDAAEALAGQIANSKASPGDQEIQSAVTGVNQAQGALETAKAIGGMLTAFATNPYEAGKMVVQNLPNSVPSIITGAAGAAAGSVAGPTGMFAGGLAGLGAGSGVVEFGAKLADKVSDALATRKLQPTVENIEAILDEPGFRDAARQEGISKGVTIGAIDAVSAVIGGRIATAPFRQASRSVLREQGVNLADSAAVNRALSNAATQEAIKARIAATPMGKKIGMAGAGVGVDSSLEGVGEYAGEAAATGQGKLGDAILEALTSVGQSGAEVAGAAALDRMREPRAEAARQDIAQRREAMTDLAKAPDVDTAVNAFERAVKKPDLPPVEFDRLGALGALHVEQKPAASADTGESIPFDYFTGNRVAAALPAPETPSGRNVFVNDTDPELTRQEQMGDREGAINAEQRAREQVEQDRELGITPGTRRAIRARVTLDESGNVLDAEDRDRQFLATVRREARGHAAAAINAHAVNPDLTEAVLAAPDMGPKAERAVFEAIANGTVGSPETQSVLARFGIAAGRLADTNGQGAQPGAAPAPGANPPGAGPGTGQGAGAQPNASGGDRGQGVAAFQIRGKWAHDMHAGALNLIARNSKSLVERAKARAELDRRNPNREFDRAAHESRKRLWRTIVQAGGISEKEAADIGIDPRSLGGYRMSGLITPNGMRADILARFLAEPGNDWLRQDQSEDDEAARQLVADLLARNPIGTPDEQNRYHELLAKKHGEAAAAAIDGLSEVEQAEVADYDDSAVAGAEAVVELIGRNVSEEEFLRALGASEQEIADVLKPRNGQENGEVAGGAGDAQETGSDAAESPDGGAETGDAALARDESGEGGNREGAAAVVEKPRYSVQSPDGKRFPVESLEEASRKWISSGTQAQRIAIMGDKAAVPIVDADGKTVALMDSAGRVSKMTGTDTPAGSDTTLVAPEKDVTAAPLYASRPVTNAADIIAWAQSQGFKTTLPAGDLHVTVAYSREPVNGASVPATGKTLKVLGDKRAVEPLGDEGAVVLKFASKVLQARWQAYRNAGASWDYEGYQPHITITYDGQGVDLTKVEPYGGPINLGPEKQEPLNEDKAEEYVEEPTSDQPPPTPVAESQDDEAWLRELFSGTAAMPEPEQKQGESDLTAVRAAIASVRAATERDLADWESRTYKQNKSQVEFRGDGPARRESMSIGAINAGRRDKAIAAFKQQLAALDKIEARIATSEGAREFKRMLDETWRKAVEGVKVDPRFKTAGELFETLVLRDLQPAQGSTTSNPLSRALLALVEPGDRGVAPAQEKAAEPITPDAAANMQRGDIVRDGQGVEYYAWSARFGRIDVVPLKDGKPVVHAGSAIRFALDAGTREANPEYRTDPLYLVRKRAAGERPALDAKTDAEKIADKVDSAASELAGIVAAEAKEKDFAPSEMPEVIANWAKDAGVPNEDLRNALAPYLRKFGVSEGRMKQIQAAISPLRNVLKPVSRETPNTEDAGAELSYNRRNRTRGGLKWSDLAGKNETLRVSETNKANVYARPDYEKMVADGMPGLIAHLVKQVYDSIAAAPVTRSAPTDENLKTYIAAVNRIMDGVMAWTQDADAVRAWATRQARIAGAMRGGTIELARLTQTEGRNLVDVVYPDGWRNYRAELMIAGGNKVLSALQPSSQEAQKASKALGEGWPAKQEAWQKSFEVRETEVRASDVPGADPNGGPQKRWAVYAKGSKWRLAKNHPDGGFATEDEAKTWAREQSKRGAKTGISDKGISVEMAQREGPARRLEGEDISSDRLKETFGFKGVNFGNWMKGDANRAERQLHLNHAYDSFMDLAELLGVPPRAVSLNGMLGVAFGAQGSGGNAAAHFVPGLNEINLTRTSGAGSLAHEWGHGLDHYFATQAGLAARKEPFLTEHLTGGDGIRPEIVARFAAIVKAMNRKSETPDQMKLRLEAARARSAKQVNGWLAAIKREFMAAEVEEAAFDRLAERIRALDLGDGKIAAGTSHLSPAVDELRGLYKAKTGRTYSLDQIRGLQSNVDHLQYIDSDKAAERLHVPQQVATDYATDAAAIDKQKGGKPYWNTELEKFARAFDAFVSDSLAAKAAANSYLSHTGRENETTPRGDERKAINAEFRALVDTIETREGDNGNVVLASRPGYTAPYRDLDAYRFTVAKDARGLPVYMSRNITLADGRVKDALGVPNGGRAIAFDIYDNRMRDAEGDPTVVGQVLVHQDAAGKFASFRNISIAKEYRNQGYYHGEGVVAGMLQHNGTTPMEVFNIQSAARGDKDDALPFWKKIGTTILNYSSTQDVDIEGNISLSRYLKAGEKRGINGQSSRDRREQPVSRRDGARGEQPDAGGNRGAQSLRASQSRTVRAVRAELTEAFGEDGVAALERAGILNITTWDAAPKGLTDQLQSGDNGAYWPSRQTAYIFADNLAPGQAAEVLLHEIGEHYGLEGILGDQYGRVVAQVKTLHKAGQPEIVAAWRHVERNYDLTPGSAVFMKEVIARAGQSAKVRGMAWWQRMIDAVRAFLIKAGLKGVTGQRDLEVLLQASLRKAMRDAGEVVPVNAGEMMAARLGDQLKGLNKDAGGDLFQGAPELDNGKTDREYAEYEGRLFGGAYSGVLGGAFAPRGSAKYKMIQAARERFNELRAERGLPEITDWTKRPADGQPLASRGTIAATWDMLQSAKTPAQARTLAMNLFDNPNKFNLWDKTIGTQLNKARKNEYFRAVFDNLQGQQDSTAAYAIEAEAEAADVLARMQGAGEIKSALKSTLTGERAKDLQAVSKAIFSRIEGREGVKQKVYTDAELAKDFGLNERQIGLYRQSRAAIDRSLDRYAQSLAVRMAQKFVYTGDLHRAGLDDTVDALTERLRLQRQVLEEQRLPEQSVEDMEARLAELEELQDSTPREILRSLQTGPDGETRQEYASMPDTAATAALQREIRDLKRAIRAGDEINPANRELDAKIAALDAALEKLPEIADQAHSLQDAGYAPAMRFGDYAVTAYDASGETQFFTMVDTKTQANLLKMRLARELPGARIVVNPVDKESYKLFGGVDPATVELFARFMEVEETDAFKAYIALATSSRSALKHMLERKGIAGFSDNLPRVMAAFITSNARAAARNVHAFDVNAAMETAQREARGDVSEEAARLVNYMNNPTGDFAKVRGFMFAYFMGGSVSSALVNLTQPLMMTTPYLQQFAGAKIGAIMTRAAKAAATGKVEGAAKAALARAEAEGITDAHEYFQLMQEAEGGGSVPTRALMKAWGSMFGAAERFNRRITFLAAFEVAQSMAQKDLQARGVGDAYEFAKDAVVETQGLYNRANRPNWARTPLGALALTFKQFSIAWLEFFMRLPRKQQLMAVGLLILMAGLEGLPFAEDLEDLIDTIGQRMGYGTNSKRALRQAATSILGETGAQFALHGISGLSGMPMDVAGRLGMGNLIPGTKLLNPSVKEKARELAEVAGPAAGLAQKAGGIAEGKVMDAMPKAFADAAKAWEIFQTGEYRDTRGRKVMEADGLDALMKMVGFQPRDVAANTRFTGEQMRDVEIVRRVESEIVEQWADGVRNKDVAESTEARERLKRWNAENPDLPIKVTFAQILRRVKQANLTRDERFMKTAPPELRRRMLAETAVQ